MISIPISLAFGYWLAEDKALKMKGTRASRTFVASFQTAIIVAIVWTVLVELFLFRFRHVVTEQEFVIGFLKYAMISFCGALPAAFFGAKDKGGTKDA